MIFYNWDNPVFSDRNEMVFADRNTVYGAYQIRKEYNRHVIAAFLISSATFIGILLILWLPTLFSDNTQQASSDVVLDQIVFNKDTEEPTKVEPPKVDPPKQQLIAAVAFVPPVVKNTTDNDSLNLNQDDLDNQNINNVTIKGIDDEVFVVTNTVTTVIDDTKPKEPFVYVAEQPEFPGGLSALYKYLGTNINYPEPAKEAGIEGKCYVRFVVTEAGKVGKIEVQKGVPGCPECDAEAKRVIKTLPEFKPGKNNGEAVPVWFQLPINFTLTK